MAKIIKNDNGQENVLELIAFSEIIAIFIRSFILNIFILCKNVASSVKCHFDTRFAPARNQLTEKFRILSLAVSSTSSVLDKKDLNDSRKSSIVCPLQLTNSILGNHMYIKLKKTKIHYVESGCENDPVILLLHGFPDFWYGWRNQMPVLSDAFYRVIALDLKGFNNSDKPLLRFNYTPAEIIRELKQFLDALSIKTVTIIGHDIGGVIAWIFTLTYPDVVSKFIPIATPHPNFYWNPSKTSITNRSWYSMIQLPVLPENEVIRNKFIEKYHGHLKSGSRYNDNGDKYERMDLLIASYKYIYSRASDWTGPLNYFRNFPFYRVNNSLNIRCPCILICGNQDPNFSLETIIGSSEYCDNPLIKIIDSAGHAPHQTHHVELNKILLKYLAGDRKRDAQLEKSSYSNRSLVGRMFNRVYTEGGKLLYA